MNKSRLLDDYHKAIQTASLHIIREHSKMKELSILKDRLFDSLKRVQEGDLKQYDLAYTLFIAYGLEYE